MRNQDPAYFSRGERRQLFTNARIHPQTGRRGGERLHGARSGRFVHRRQEVVKASQVIERDIRQIRNMPDLRSFSEFLALAAARHAQPFHPAGLARELGVSQPTVKSWGGGMLEASYVAHFLPPWFRNYGKRVVKASKLYFYDPALVNLLTRQPDAGAALAGPLGGALLEGWVVTEAAKAFMALGRRPDIHFWRSHDGLEVDLLIAIGGKLQAVEIKLTATPGPGHIEPLARFLSLAGDEALGQRIIVCRTERARFQMGTSRCRGMNSRDGYEGGCPPQSAGRRRCPIGAGLGASPPWCPARMIRLSIRCAPDPRARRPARAWARSQCDPDPL